MRYFGVWLLAGCFLFTGCCGNKFVCKIDLTGATPTTAEADSRPLCLIGSTDYRPTNLVFQGGGVKGIAYVGALQVLEEQEILQGVKKVAGTSAGAITATLVALGYTPDEIHQMMTALDFTKFEDGEFGGIFRIFRRYGFFKGDYFLDWMRCQVAKKTGSEGTTFRQLEADSQYRKLKLFTTDVTTGEIQELSASATPDLEVALAARMSMSIPLFFASIEHEAFGKKARGQRHVFVDGGVLFNYPITAFDRDSLNPDTLGFVLFDTKDQAPPARIDGLLSYTRALVEADLNAQVDDLRFDPANLVRTAVMDDLGVGTTDFKLSNKTKAALVRSGADCTCRYLTERHGASDRLEELMSLIPQRIAVPKTNFERCGWVLGAQGES